MFSKSYWQQIVIIDDGSLDQQISIQRTHLNIVYVNGRHEIGLNYLNPQSLDGVSERPVNNGGFLRNK